MIYISRPRVVVKSSSKSACRPMCVGKVASGASRRGLVQRGGGAIGVGGGLEDATQTSYNHSTAQCLRLKVQINRLQGSGPQ